MFCVCFCNFAFVSVWFLCIFICSFHAKSLLLSLYQADIWVHFFDFMYIYLFNWETLLTINAFQYHLNEFLKILQHSITIFCWKRGDKDSWANVRIWLCAATSLARICKFRQYSFCCQTHLVSGSAANEPVTHTQTCCLSPWTPNESVMADCS